MSILSNRQKLSKERVYGNVFFPNKMKRIYPLFILVLFIFLSNLGEVFAVEVTCPPSKKTEATPDDIHGKIKQCVEARKKRNEASLNTS